MRILYDPAPRQTDEIFSDAAQAQFFEHHQVTNVDPAARDETYAAELPKAEVVISQQALGQDRLNAALRLRAIFNVETNFLPNIDYELCFHRGIHVLTPASVFAAPVAEMGLGMALSLARNIHGAHGDFCAGRERYGLDGNGAAELLSGSDIGFVGFGDLGRALHRLLMPFQARIRVYDPWLPDGHLHRLGVEPVGFQPLLRQSRVVFVVASVTSENAHLFDKAALAEMPDGAMLVLLSRAALVDFDALAEEARAGRLRVATDVFPEEPVTAEDPLRQVPNILFSAHRAGALTSALYAIGDYVLEDLELIAQGLPPVACRRAERETVAMMRSQPVSTT